ncbi:MAG: Short-chain alcohol dehydrogenase of unknown specificity [Roseibaca calidilacus]|uniref:Short-chain dehydrogenase n=1 Tax=Roseibaca calidilacus TaxID=1666912 RepID=A0A0N8K7T8_9RHOB|nr:SDR family oxidoreductase [Roseibaca calidilacus]KPP92657.1 MAG: Short-chain alcohol dehydrogenase of unknown specificity [Roseibaca calidilacus]CUX80271.1 hypothetical protein Ga0058931_0978 [Roseibaca calidilacus]
MTQKQIALVTGASRGIGAALSEELAARGWHIVAVARTLGALEELDDRIKARGGSATLAALDVTIDDAMRHLCRDIHDRWGSVGLWAHCAIQAPPLSPVSHNALKEWDKALAVNARATGVLIPMVAPLLAASPDKGTALFLEDTAAEARFHSCYGATKLAQIALARAWADESVKTGPRVLVEACAPMPTALRARFHPGENRDALTPCAAEAARLADLIG